MLSDEEWHERRRRRLKSIDRFAEQQRVKRDWIALSDIADSCASSTTTASAAAQEDARALAWLLLDRSARNGEFEQQRTSKILYLDPELWRDGKKVPYRLQREQLAYIEHLRDLPVSCWLPREVARRWLLAHGYPWPAHFEPATMGCISSVGEGTAAHPGPEAASAPQPSAAKPGARAGEVPPAPRRQHGPTSTADKIKEAADVLIREDRVPGETVPWEQFQELLCEKLKVKPGTRGYGLDTIQNALRPILKERQAKKTAAEITESTES